VLLAGVWGVPDLMGKVKDKVSGGRCEGRDVHLGKVKDKVSGGRCEGRDVHLGKEFSA
jgi:hypothetical protein